MIECIQSPFLIAAAAFGHVLCSVAKVGVSIAKKVFQKALKKCLTNELKSAILFVSGKGNTQIQYLIIERGKQ